MAQYTYMICRHIHTFIKVEMIRVPYFSVFLEEIVLNLAWLLEVGAKFKVIFVSDYNWFIIGGNKQ